MKKLLSVKFQFATAIVMFLISIFMTISYYIKISNNDVDRLTYIAFYVWIFLIILFLIKVINNVRIINKSKKIQKKGR